MMDFAKATPDENQSRLISGAVSGTLFLNSDDLTSSTGQTLAMTYLTNAAINAVSRIGKTFRPVEGNTGTNATEVLTLRDVTDWYLAVFNYTDSATKQGGGLHPGNCQEFPARELGAEAGEAVQISQSCGTVTSAHPSVTSP